MIHLKTLKSQDTILELFDQSPITDLLEFHNLNFPFKAYTSAEILIVMCMDHRKKLQIPSNFAYIIRTGGANVRPVEFQLSYAISVGDIKHVVIIGHNHCGMVNLLEKKEAFINGLIKNAGWTFKKSNDYFNQLSKTYEINNAGKFVWDESIRLKKAFPKLTIAPLFYTVEDNLLHLVQEE